ncbi:MAG: exopolysaccharide biosynthesis polyprenyl glycosylphosphotransferase [Candidatus Marinamargulisbacteria bacterium]|jgi:exopolysaccharide biosynthesis polyprenyl glycosylphosphotransferase
MKKATYFIFAKFILDCLLIPVTIVVAYSLKFKVGWVFQNVFSTHVGIIYDHAQVEPYLRGLGLIMMLWIFTFYLVGLYRPFDGVMSEIDEVAKVAKGVTFAILETVAIIFVFNAIPGSRFVILYMWVIGICLITIGRLLIHSVELRLLRKGFGARRAAIMGAEQLGQDVAERILLNAGFRLIYVGTLAEKRPERLHFHLRNSFVLLGQAQNYESILIDNKIDEVFVTWHIHDEPFFNDFVLFCEKNHIALNLLSDLSNLMSGSLNIRDFDGVPFIVHKEFPKKPFQLILKRIFDFVVSGIFLILLLPLFIIVAICIKIVSPGGPVFYLQERIGKDSVPFQMIKFRTMIPDAEGKSGPVLVNENGESRYIRIGQLLRNTSIDELPQLINIFRGEMSVVGPRPERAYFVNQFQKDVPFFGLRHHVKGGLTGWAQINGRSVLTRRPDHKIKYDLYYIKNWSLILDLKIILKTVFVVIRKEEAY